MSSGLRSSTFAPGEKTTDEEADKRINIKRSKSHRIFDVSCDISKHSFTRNCTFKYKENKGVKTYKKKEAELKIEKYNNIGQLEKDGERIGYKMLNLSDFVDKGFINYTYKMSKNEEIYLTVKILVISTGFGGDIPNTALRAIQQQRTAGANDSDSSDEQEISGD